MRRLIKTVFFIFFSGIILFSCGPKPYYKTAEGKKKWKRYNSIQYDREDHKAPKGKRRY